MLALGAYLPGPVCHSRRSTGARVDRGQPAPGFLDPDDDGHPDLGLSAERPMAALVCDDGAVQDDPLDLISINPAVCHGQPCVKGTRVMVTVVLDALAAGLDVNEILRHHPTLTAEGVRAAVAYGAWLAKQEVRPLTPTR